MAENDSLKKKLLLSLLAVTASPAKFGLNEHFKWPPLNKDLLGEEERQANGSRWWNKRTKERQKEEADARRLERDRERQREEKKEEEVEGSLKDVSAYLSIASAISIIRRGVRCCVCACVRWPSSDCARRLSNKKNQNKKSERERARRNADSIRPKGGAIKVPKETPLLKE